MEPVLSPGRVLSPAYDPDEPSYEPTQRPRVSGFDAPPNAQMSDLRRDPSEYEHYMSRRVRSRSPPPIRRQHPYARPSSAPAHMAAPPRDADRGSTNYHWKTLCGVRNNDVEVYKDMFNLQNQIKSGRPIMERQISSVLSKMANFLACGACGKLIDRLDNTVFVARCGHVFHKSGCWQSAGSTCALCPPPNSR